MKCLSQLLQALALVVHQTVDDLDLAEENIVLFTKSD